MRLAYWEVPVALRRMMLVGTLLIVGLILWFVPDSVPTRNPILLIIVALPMIPRVSATQPALWDAHHLRVVVGRSVVSPERDRRHGVARLGPGVARDDDPLDLSMIHPSKVHTTSSR